ncbi:MAG: hypothetical protein ACJ73S_17040 [Mycobacteriales bacterium]
MRRALIGLALAGTAMMAAGCGGGDSGFTLTNPSGQPSGLHMPTSGPTDLPTGFPTSGPTDSSSSSTSADPNDDSVPHTVVFTVTGSGQATINYSRGTEVLTVKSSLPWTITVNVPAGQFAGHALTATSSDFNEATMACKVTVDGNQVASDSGNGSAFCF